MMTEKEIRLVEESVPLAGYVAKRWVKQAGIEWEDALSAAEYGLVKAAMSFEEERGFCFSTYAVRVMENEIRMELRKRNRRKKVVYFGAPVSGAEGLPLGDTIADTRDHFGMSETVHDLIRNRDLTEKEREAVLLRFQHPEKTQEECGQMIGIGQSALSKYLNSARRKLKRV